MVALVGLVGFAACGGDSDSKTENPFASAPECEGEQVVPLAGTHQMVFSALTLGTKADGFDLDGDGEPDNKFAAVSSLAAEPIAEALADYSLVLPMEFFDLADQPTDDACVKFALYQGEYRLDLDEDGRETAREGGDCNDHREQASPGAAEIPDNSMDDDCDGLADETEEIVDEQVVVTPSADEADADGDGFSLAQGDCDDTNDAINPGQDEICGDGLDNNCDGSADWTVGAATPHCSPFDDDLDPLGLSPNSFRPDGEPQIAFKSGSITTVDGVLKFRSGPSLFTLVLPIVDGIELELRITGTTIEADMVLTPAGRTLQNGRLGGVLDTHSMDQVRGLDITEIGLRPEDSFADALYTNMLGVLLGLRKAPAGTPGAGCLTPDIDVDGDGLEAFCDTTPEEEPLLVDKCVDGDGTVVLDSDSAQCSEATDEDGNLRFVDGVSIMIKFETLPATLPAE